MPGCARETKLLMCDLEEGCITELIELTDPVAVK